MNPSTENPREKQKPKSFKNILKEIKNNKPNCTNIKKPITLTPGELVSKYEKI